jgi:hypothetical protein
MKNCSTDSKGLVITIYDIKSNEEMVKAFNKTKVRKEKFSIKDWSIG